MGTFNVGDEVTGLTSGVIADVVSWDADARELEVIIVGPEDFTTNEFIQGPAQTLPAVTAYFNLSTTELLETTLIAKDIPTFDAGDIVFGVTTTTDGEVQSYQQNTANIISSNVKITYNNVTPTGNVFTVNTVIQVIENGNVIGQGTVQSFDADAGFFLMNNITGYFKVGDQIDAQVVPLGGGGAVAVTADITVVENFLDLNQVNGTGIAEKYEVYDNASNWSSKVKILERKSATLKRLLVQLRWLLTPSQLLVRLSLHQVTLSPLCTHRMMLRPSTEVFLVLLCLVLVASQQSIITCLFPTMVSRLVIRSHIHLRSVLKF